MSTASSTLFFESGAAGAPGHTRLHGVCVYGECCLIPVCQGIEGAKAFGQSIFSLQPEFGDFVAYDLTIPFLFAPNRLR